MRILISLLATCLLTGMLTWADETDTELEEKLKDVMILFDRSQQGLKEEIESLELQVSYLEKENARLKSDLAAADQEVLDLKTQLLLKESESAESSVAADVVAAEVIASASSSNLGNQAAGGGRGQGGRA